MAAPDPRIKAYLDANEAWASSAQYKAPLPLLEMQKKGKSRADGTVIILACCDPRLNVEQIFGIGGGTSAGTIVRVTGGRVRTALSSLLVLTAVGNEGKKGLIIVCHHTDCGLGNTTDEAIKESLKKRASGPEEEKEIEGMVFGSISDPEETVKADVKVLRESSFFKGMQIVGFVHNTKMGLLKEIVGI